VVVLRYDISSSLVGVVKKVRSRSHFSDDLLSLLSYSHSEQCRYRQLAAMDATSATSSAASSVDGRSVGGGAPEYLNLGMFSSGGSGQPQLSSDLLVGDGAFSLGNGFGNDSGAVGGTSFDLSDFPSLGGTSLGGTANAAVSAGNGLAQALRQQQQQQHQQQQLLAHQQMLQVGSAVSKSSNLYRLAMTAGSNGNNFNMTTEDFPALSSGAPASSNASASASALNSPSLLGGSASVVSMSRTSSAAGSALYGSDLDNNQQTAAPGLLGGTAGLGGLGGLRQLSQASTPSMSRSGSSAGAIGTSAAATAGSALNGDFGLLGLLGVIRMTDADRNALALGSDLTLLGLNLGSTEQIYGTFSGPWSDTAASKEPHYQVRYGSRPSLWIDWSLGTYASYPLFFVFFSYPHVITCSHQH
jgi:hypothetical protein